MGSIVIDAVNHFFNNSPHHISTPAESFEQGPSKDGSPTPTSPTVLQQRNRRHHHAEQQSCDSSQSNTSMSLTSSRAASSHAPSVTNTQHVDPTQSQSQSQSQSARSYTRQRPTKPSPDRPAESTKSTENNTTSDTRASSPASASSASGSLSQAPSVSSDESTLLHPRCIKIKDLAHIQRLADSDTEAFSDSGQTFRQKSGDQGPQYEISGMPIEHIIEMVAGLLTKITTANDMQHEHLHRQMPTHDSSSTMSSQTSSVLAFHGKNVPSITILSYLNRINKYCPTSYEVFLSLLVYFDRMTEKVNSGPIQSLRDMNQQATERAASRHSEGNLRSSAPSTQSMEGVTPVDPAPAQTATPPLSGEFEKQYHSTVPGTPYSKPHHLDSPSTSSLEADSLNLSHFFVVDSFNIHRLVIAGVTCASKFFSDIFYTNSRYAKVGGLPLPELNHLELQFLLLNDFRLSIPVEEMEAYGTMLVEFYAREVLLQRQAENGRRASVPVAR